MFDKGRLANYFFRLLRELARKRMKLHNLHVAELHENRVKLSCDIMWVVTYEILSRREKKHFNFLSWSLGKLSTDSDHLNPLNNNNNHKWPTSCTNLLQNSINCINNSSSSSTGSTTNNNNSSLTNNNNSLKPSNHLTSMTLSHNMQTHHHHHHHALSSALSSPFSSLLGASGGAGYLLDPLGNLQKSAASNHLF